MATNVLMWLAIFLGANILFMSWLWYRARPESGDRLVLPTMILMSVAMLIGILPIVLWPHWEAVQITGSIASVLLTGVVLIASLRRTRRLRQGRPSDK
jgi:heme A synthase